MIHHMHLLRHWQSLLFIVSILQIGSAPTAAQEAPPSYRLNPGDTIQTFVLGEPDLSVEVSVTTDGTIFFPLLGDVPVAGLTERQTAAALTELLAGDYLINPRITVNVVGFRQYFLQGAVQNPGGQSYRPGLTVGRAIAEAGGFNERASRNKIYLVRESDPSGKRTKVTPDTPVEPGDIITVEESFF